MSEIHRNSHTTDLQSSLETFLEGFAEFSDVSLKKYMELAVDINKAKEQYENVKLKNMGK
jgi:phosphoribosylformylglycinamidine (FGAM) synthase PurS component